MDKKDVMIVVKDAAQLMQCSQQNVWNLIKRKSLKAKKVFGRWVTCQKWIDEYYENWHSKDLHSIFNGRKVFDPAEGRYSVRQVSEIVGKTKAIVEGHIRYGKLKTVRTGSYHVILEKDLKEYLDKYYPEQLEFNFA